MHLVYLDESGNTGNNLHDKSQPIFVLAAMVVAEPAWLPMERELAKAVDQYFPPPRPPDFEVHSSDVRSGRGYFRQFKVDHRVRFRDEWIRIAQHHGVRIVYRATAKSRFRRWLDEKFGAGIAINPHVVAFALVSRVVNDFLRTSPGAPLGIFIADENKEIVKDIEKSIKVRRGIEGTLRLDQIIEKGFFIDSSASLMLQLCDLFALLARKKEEEKAGMRIASQDRQGVAAMEPLIHQGDLAHQDVLEWVVAQWK